MNQKTLRIANIAMIAAIYTALSVALSPLSYGNIQVRIAEALTMLPLIYYPGIHGVILGCFLTNLIGVFTGANVLGVLDVFVGTFATAIAAFATYYCRNFRIRHIPFLSMMAPVVSNGVIIGIELGVVLFPESIITGSLICGAEVAAGELVSVILGLFLIAGMKKRNIFKGK